MIASFIESVRAMHPLIALPIFSAMGFVMMYVPFKIIEGVFESTMSQAFEDKHKKGDEG